MYKTKVAVGVFVDPKDKGCSFSVDVNKRVLKFRMWGLWDEPQLKAFQDGFREYHQKLGPGPFRVYADMKESLPQRPDIAVGAKEVIMYAVQAGMTKAAHLMSQTLTELQVKRLASEANAKNFRYFRTEKEAMEWLMKDEDDE